MVPGAGKVQRLFEIAGFPPGDALFADAPAGPAGGDGAEREAEPGRFELLEAAGEVADGTLMLEETVVRLLGLVVPVFADVATLDSISASGEMRRLGSRVDAPRHREELEAALMRRRPLPDAPVGLSRAIVSAESQLLTHVTDDDLRAIASSDEDFELLRALELRSAVFVPLRARGRTVGALACGVGTSGREYDEDDLRFAEALSDGSRSRSISPRCRPDRDRARTAARGDADPLPRRCSSGKLTARSCSPTRRPRGC